MATTSYATLPSTTYLAHGSHHDPYHPNNDATYDSNATHPYHTTNLPDHQQQPHHSNDDHSTKTHAQQSDGYSHPPAHTNNARPVATNSTDHTDHHSTVRTTQPPPKNNGDNQHVESNHHQQTSYGSKAPHHSQPVADHHHQSNRAPRQQQKLHHRSQPPAQSTLTRSEHQITKGRTSPSAHHRSPSNTRNKQTSETGPKPYNPLLEQKPTKSSTMRAAAIKKKEESLEKKRNEQYFPAGQNKASPPLIKSQQTSPQSDADQSDEGRSKRNAKHLSKSHKHPHTDGEQSDSERKTHGKKQSHSQLKHHRSRHDHHQHHPMDDNNSSGEDDHHRSKSKKRTTFPDSHLDKHPHLPPLRFGRMPPHYDPYMDYPFPHGHPLRGRFPHHDPYMSPYGPYPSRFGHQHLYEDADDIPPYIGPYHDAYDPFFDYEKRRAKSKQRIEHDGNHGHEAEREEGSKSQQSRKSKPKHKNHEHTGRKSRRDYEENMHAHYPPGYYAPPYYDGNDMLEMWRQERNDYLKKKFKPTIHDVLYSQQWMKSDSYLENQRRRALRDAQGYYFPYKKYTLQDYKDLQKTKSQNPFSDVNETTIDRKERARKRQEYGFQVERQILDNPGTRQVPPRELPPRKPWHLSNGEPQISERTSKRERALEYSKDQVKYHPLNYTPPPADGQNPNEQDENNSYRARNNDDDDDDDQSHHQRPGKTNQVYDDYDE